MIFLLWFFPPPVLLTLEKGPLAELLPACVFIPEKGFSG
jgi:hypothetical protein